MDLSPFRNEKTEDFREYLFANPGLKISSNSKTLSWTRSEFPQIFSVGGIYREISSTKKQNKTNQHFTPFIKYQTK